MANMFENYDNNRFCCPCHIHTEDCPEILMGWSGAEIIHNYNGNEIGLGFTAKNPIELTFHFNGFIIDDNGDPVDIDEFINTSDIKLEVLNFKHQVIYSTIFEGQCEDQFMTIKFSQELLDMLTPEIYYIKLKAITDNAEYVLFTPRDGIIHIS